MTVKTCPWDPAEYLGDEDAIAEYLSAALEEGDPALFTVALGDIARARGITDLARKTRLSRQALYKALSGQGNPEFATNLQRRRRARAAPQRRAGHQAGGAAAPAQGPEGGLGAGARQGHYSRPPHSAAVWPSIRAVPALLRPNGVWEYELGIALAGNYG